MSLFPEDPRWTAYLLDELDEADRKACEAELEANPGRCAEVEALSQTLDFMREALKQPVAGGDTVREDCARALRPPRAPLRFWLPTAVAAMLALGVGLSRYLTLPRQEMKLRGEFDLFEAGQYLEMEKEEGLSVGFAAGDVNLPAPAAAPLPPSRPASPPHPVLPAEPLMRRQAVDGRAEPMELRARSAYLEAPTPTPTPTPTPAPEEDKDDEAEDEAEDEDEEGHAPEAP